MTAPGPGQLGPSLLDILVCSRRRRPRRETTNSLHARLESQVGNAMRHLRPSRQRRRPYPLAASHVEIRVTAPAAAVLAAGLPGTGRPSRQRRRPYPLAASHVEIRVTAPAGAVLAAGLPGPGREPEAACAFIHDCCGHSCRSACCSYCKRGLQALIARAL